MSQTPDLLEAFAPIKRPQGGGMQPGLTREDIEFAIAERRKGRTCEEVAAKLFVHPSTVSRWTTRYGGEYRRRLPVRRVSPDSLLQTMELLQRGYSARDIATLQGLHPTSVRWRLRKYGRDQSWRNRPNKLSHHDTPRGV